MKAIMKLGKEKNDYKIYNKLLDAKNLINTCLESDTGILELFYSLLIGYNLTYKRKGNKDIVVLVTDNDTLSVVVDWETKKELWWLNGELKRENVLDNRTFRYHDFIKRVAKLERKDIIISLDEMKKICKKYEYAYNDQHFFADSYFWKFDSKTYIGDIPNSQGSLFCRIIRICDTMFLYEYGGNSKAKVYFHELSTREKVKLNKDECKEERFYKTFFKKN